MFDGFINEMFNPAQEALEPLFIVKDKCKPGKKIESSNPQNLLPFGMEINILKGNVDIL